VVKFLRAAACALLFASCVLTPVLAGPYQGTEPVYTVTLPDSYQQITADTVGSEGSADLLGLIGYDQAAIQNSLDEEGLDVIGIDAASESNIQIRTRHDAYSNQIWAYQSLTAANMSAAVASAKTTFTKGYTVQEAAVSPDTGGGERYIRFLVSAAGNGKTQYGIWYLTIENGYYLLLQYNTPAQPTSQDESAAQAIVESVKFASAVPKSVGAATETTSTSNRLDWDAAIPYFIAGAVLFAAAVVVLTRNNRGGRGERARMNLPKGPPPRYAAADGPSQAPGYARRDEYTRDGADDYHADEGYGEAGENGSYPDSGGRAPSAAPAVQDRAAPGWVDLSSYSADGDAYAQPAPRTQLSPANAPIQAQAVPPPPPPRRTPAPEAPPPRSAPPSAARGILDASFLDDVTIENLD